MSVSRLDKCVLAQNVSKINSVDPRIQHNVKLKHTYVCMYFVAGWETKTAPIGALCVPSVSCVKVTLINNAVTSFYLSNHGQKDQEIFLLNRGNQICTREQSYHSQFTYQ